MIPSPPPGPMDPSSSRGLAPGDSTSRMTLAPADLVAWREGDGARGLHLRDWCADAASVADGTVAWLQLRRNPAAEADGPGSRLRVQVLGADKGMPAVHGTWPAAAWPQREATERHGLLLSGTGIPEPLWTGAVRDAHDREDGVDPLDDDGLVPLAGPDPASPWRLDLRVRWEGGRVAAARARPGLLHSGFEERARSRAFDLLPVLAEGLNDQAPYAPGLAAALAAEALLGVTPPRRCTRVRTVLAEVSRIAAHCAWLAVQCSADPGLWAQALSTRDAAARFLAAASGRRWATGTHRVGGTTADLTPEHTHLLDVVAQEVDALRRAAERRTLRHRGWRSRFDGVAIIDAPTARAWAVSGPNLRASGIAEDGRRTDPYLDYADLEFSVPVGTRGDVVDRVAVRLEELGQSIGLCRQCLEALPDGPTQIHEAPRPAAAPEPAQLIAHFERWMDGHGHRPAPQAEACVITESADGELSFLLVSDGTGKPAFAHLRSPSLYHFQIVEDLLTDQRQFLVPGILASLNIIAPEMDR